MSYLFKKMRKDLTSMWTQFFSVFMMAFLGVLIFSGMEGVWGALDYQLNELNATCNTADAWCYGNAITDEQLNQIIDLEDVDALETAMTTTVKSKVNSNKTDVKLIAEDENSISSVYVTDGNAFLQGDNTNGIWLDTTYAKCNQIQVGDTVDIEVGNHTKQLQVQGLIIHPEYVYYTGSTTIYAPDHNKQGYGVIHYNTADQLFGPHPVNEVRMKVKENTNMTSLQESIESILGSQYYGFADHSKLPGVADPEEKVGQIRIMSVMFSAVFILLAMLTMLTTMTRLVSNQQIQIGTLKALGFSDGSIKLHYVMFGLCISLLGGVTAVILGPLCISPIIMGIQKSLYTLPSYAPRISYYSFGVILIIIVMCTIATLIACDKYLKGMPAETMRGRMPGSGRKPLLERFPFLWKHTTFETKWSMRDIARNKVRSSMGVIGVLGSMVLLMAGLGMQYTLNKTNHDMYYKQYNYANKVTLTPSATAIDRNELETLFDLDHSSPVAWLMENNAEIMKGNEKYTGMISVYQDETYLSIYNTAGVQIKLPKQGACITRKCADILGVGIGDEIDVRAIGDTSKQKIKVTEIITSPNSQGIIMSKDAYEDLGKTFVATALQTGNEMDYSFIEDLDYVKECVTLDEQYRSAQDFVQSLNIIFILLITCAMVLAVVILYNLGILSYTERVREYATMKVLGFYQKEISFIALRENGFTMVIGWLLGIPSGLAFLMDYVNAVSTDKIEWIPQLSNIRFVIASVITIGITLLVSILLSLKVKKINMLWYNKFVTPMSNSL